MDRAWLLIKERDDQARQGGPELTETRPESVATGRTMEEIAADRTQRLALEAVARRPGRTRRAPGRRRCPPGPSRRGRCRAAKPPEGDDWLHEIAIAGVRVLARNERSKIQLFSDRGTPLPAKAARKDKPIGDAVRMLPAETLLVDGIVAPLSRRQRQARLLPVRPRLPRRPRPVGRAAGAAQGAAGGAGAARGPGTDPLRRAHRGRRRRLSTARRAGWGSAAMVSRKAGSQYDAQAGLGDGRRARRTKARRRQPPRSPRPAAVGGYKPAPATPPRCRRTFRLTHPERVLWPDVGRWLHEGRAGALLPGGRATSCCRRWSGGRCRCFAARRGCRPTRRRARPASS